MLSTVKVLIQNLNDEKEKLEQENQELKKKLSYRHTEINDLRWSKKQLQKQIEKKL